MAQYAMVNGTLQFRHEGENTTRTTTTVPVSPDIAHAPAPQNTHMWGLPEDSIEIFLLLLALIDACAGYVKYRWRRYL